MSGPTAAQIDALLDYLNEHQDLARGNLRSIEGRLLSRRLWEELHCTLNAMGGCTKTIKQWQKVWTDKKHLAKKAAAAARRSASATGGGPSSAPPLSGWELKIISIMGDGFADPQTSAATQPFGQQLQVQPSEGETAASAHEPLNIDFSSQNESQSQPTDQQPRDQQPTASSVPTQSPLTSTRRRRGTRRLRESLRSENSVRDRLFRHDERRLELEVERNVLLAGINNGLQEVCRILLLRSQRDI